MKKVSFSFLIMLLASVALLFNSCKKDEAVVDARDKYVGTWKGTTTIIVSSLDMNETSATTQTVTKSTTNSSQISFTELGSTDPSKANVNGNSYIYEDETYTENSNGITMTIKMTGGGSINGNVITESGSVTISASGKSYTGTWTGTLNKQ